MEEVKRVDHKDLDREETLEVFQLVQKDRLRFLVFLIE